MLLFWLFCSGFVFRFHFFFFQSSESKNVLFQPQGDSTAKVPQTTILVEFRLVFCKMSSEADVLQGKDLLKYIFFLSKGKKKKKFRIKILHRVLSSELYVVSLVIKAQGCILRHSRLIPASTANPRSDLERATSVLLHMRGALRHSSR